MTRHTKILISILLAIISLGGFTVGNTHALTYQDTLDTSFTFNSSIAITLSSSDLVISELTPNTYADSNIITITAASNNPAGYEVTATAGNGTTFTSTSLIDRENNSNPDSFTSLGTTDSYDISSNDFGYGKWGYTYSTDSGTTWINANGTGYSGLPYYGNAGANILTTSTSGTSSLQFKIGAKATATQLAGTYNNVVNFAVTANPELDNSMQGFAAGTAGTTCSSMSIGDTIALIDSRDNTSYNVGKLADGKCWMLENLDLAGGTALDADKTDVTGAYISSFSTSNNLTKESDTIVLPESSTSGFGTDNYSYVYNSGNKTDCGASGQNTPCYSYYSWDAVTLGSGRNITTQNTDAPYSICPKGWRLPTSGQHDGTTPLTNWKRGDFYRLLTAYGANLESAYNQNTPTFWNNAGAGTTANFLLSGVYYGSTFYDGGTYGNYWSSTSTSSTGSRYLGFDTGYVNSADRDYRRNGFSVRCLLR